MRGLMKSHQISIFVFFLLLVFAATLQADIAEYDAYLKKKADEALQSSLQAYYHNPEEVTDNFNEEVGDTIMNWTNTTRRHLRGSHCKATNSIDRCWRCDQDWAKHRKRLAFCARGFGSGTTGGLKGRFYVVTDSSDKDMENPKPGTLRHAVIQEEPLWIIFKKSMVITLKQELIINHDKTIDGRGVSVHIAYGAGLTIQFVRNVIIHGIKIHHILPKMGGMIRDSVNHIGLRTMSDGDGISIFGSNHVWLDHLTMSRCSDGLIDAIMASTAITISNCKFNHHNHVLLLGASDLFSEDAIMQVTVAFNRFGKGLIQRMPRCRWGFFHIVNNDYTKWEMYAIGGSSRPTIVSQGNRFKASSNPFTKQVTKREIVSKNVWKNWQWRSEGDLFLNGAYFVESGEELHHYNNTRFNNTNRIRHRPASYVGRLTRTSGALKCKVGRFC
ncbi:PREDICTED: pectate lyase-like [Ipomoea nil]|uniref:pectate lyase-like n=1 Tax=Ipomoea nil TaxID=35883 RepID=UPI0009016AAB|nr:PREDICTED: pectate lyase-like [Ipomoea nil]